VAAVELGGGGVGGGGGGGGGGASSKCGHLWARLNGIPGTPSLFT